MLLSVVVLDGSPGAVVASFVVVDEGLGAPFVGGGEEVSCCLDSLSSKAFFSASRAEIWSASCEPLESC